MTSARRRFLFLFAPVALSLLAVCVASYARHLYYGDFYSFHAACEAWLLRGKFEAYPLYENLFGVHSYLTLPLLAPLVAWLKTPLLFPLVSLGLWCGACFLFYEICEHLNGESSAESNSPLLFGGLFFSFPLVLHFAAPQYDPFEPDFVVMPLLLGMFWAMLTRRRFYFYAAFSFLLGTKEEFIVLAPVFLLLLWRLCVLHGGAKWTFARRDVLVIAGLWSLAALFSALVLIRFRSLNQIGFFNRSGIYPELLFDKDRLASSLGAVCRLMGSVVPLLGLLLLRADGRSRRLLLASLLLFPVGRELLAIVTYPESVPFYAHWRIVLAPTLLLTVAVVAYHLRDVGRLSQRALNRGLIAVLLLNVAFGALLKGSARDRLLAVIFPLEAQRKAREATELRQWVGARGKEGEILVLPEDLYPWFYRWGNLMPSPTLFPWQRHHPRDTERSPFFVFEKIEDRVRFVVLERTDSDLLKERVAQGMVPVGATSRLLIFAKEGP